eukprot:scaffold62715_cov63-Phaeocystis_antarctica.AAC.2
MVRKSSIWRRADSPTKARCFGTPAPPVPPTKAGTLCRLKQPTLTRSGYPPDPRPATADLTTTSGRRLADASFVQRLARGWMDGPRSDTTEAEPSPPPEPNGLG